MKYFVRGSMNLFTLVTRAVNNHEVRQIPIAQNAVCEEWHKLRDNEVLGRTQCVCVCANTTMSAMKPWRKESDALREGVPVTSCETQ